MKEVQLQNIFVIAIYTESKDLKKNCSCSQIKELKIKEHCSLGKERR